MLPNLHLSYCVALSLTAGYSENGFAFDETNEIQLEFPIPKVSTTGDGPEVELWILPDKSQTPPNKVDKITFRAVADIPQASNPRIHIANLLWNTNQDCVQLNLTSLSRKISKILQKKNLNETIMSLAVSIVRVEELEGEFQPNASVNPFHHDLCNSMLQRESNDSFLVIKNYDERGIQDQFSQQPGPPASASAQKSHNNDKVLPMGLSAAGASVSVSRQHADSSCGVVPLVVNLTDVYGDFIKAPIVIDVRDCSGRCTLLHDSSKFSKHGEIKERLKFLPGGESLSNYEPSCTPIKFQPLQVLIGLQAKSDVIVQMSDLVVDRCACQ